MSEAYSAGRSDSGCEHVGTEVAFIRDALIAVSGRGNKITPEHIAVVTEQFRGLLHGADSDNEDEIFLWATHGQVSAIADALAAIQDLPH